MFSPEIDEAIYYVGFWIVPAVVAVIMTALTTRRERMTYEFTAYTTGQECAGCGVPKEQSSGDICPILGTHQWKLTLQERPPVRIGWRLMLQMSWDALMRRGQ